MSEQNKGYMASLDEWTEENVFAPLRDAWLPESTDPLPVTVGVTFLEENVKKAVVKPWIAFGSDEASQAPEGVFLKSNPHPRAYGNFARVLGKYCRDEKVIPLEEAVRRLSALPAWRQAFPARGEFDIARRREDP